MRVLGSAISLAAAEKDAVVAKALASVETIRLAREIANLP